MFVVANLQTLDQQKWHRLKREMILNFSPECCLVDQPKQNLCPPACQHVVPDLQVQFTKSILLMSTQTDSKAPKSNQRDAEKSEKSEKAMRIQTWKKKLLENSNVPKSKKLANFTNYKEWYIIIFLFKTPTSHLVRDNWNEVTLL